MFGDAPEWTFWALVGLLPGLKRCLMGCCDIRLIKLHRFFEFTRPVLRHRAYAFGSLHLPD
jgi:hypothetical protein